MRSVRNQARSGVAVAAAVVGALALVGCGGAEERPVETLGPADLHFRPVLEVLAPGGAPDGESVLAERAQSDLPGPLYRVGPTVLDGTAIESATSGAGGAGGAQWVVKPVFAEGPNGIDLFNSAAAMCNARAAECPTGQLAIVFDGVVLSAPLMYEATFGRDSIEISGAFTEEEARRLAIALDAG